MKDRDKILRMYTVLLQSSKFYFLVIIFILYVKCGYGWKDFIYVDIFLFVDILICPTISLGIYSYCSHDMEDEELPNPW